MTSENCDICETGSCFVRGDCAANDNGARALISIAGKNIFASSSNGKARPKISRKNFEFYVILLRRFRRMEWSDWMAPDNCWPVRMRRAREQECYVHGNLPMLRGKDGGDQPAEPKRLYKLRAVAGG
jgi:hypothetical protein